MYWLNDPFTPSRSDSLLPNDPRNEPNDTPFYPKRILDNGQAILRMEKGSLQMTMAYSLCETRLRGSCIHHLGLETCFDKKKFHDSLQACVIEETDN